MLFGLSEECTQLLVRGDYLIQEKIIVSKGNIFGTLVMDGLIQCDCIMRSRVSQKGKKKLFNFLKIEYLLKALNIYQVLKILFWYLFYFRRYKAKSNLRVEQKTQDWWHFTSTSTCHPINNFHEWFTIHTVKWWNCSFAIKSTYISSFQRAETLSSWKKRKSICSLHWRGNIVQW